MHITLSCLQILGLVPLLTFQIWSLIGWGRWASVEDDFISRRGGWWGHQYHCYTHSPYLTHSLGDSSKCHRGKGLKTVCLGLTRTSVLPFLGNDSNVHENMMLPKLDTFVLLTIEGPSLDKRDEHWARSSMEMMACAWGQRTELQVMISGHWSHHNECMKPWTKYTRCHFINFVQRLF